jgi:hypothetical protein
MSEANMMRIAAGLAVPVEEVRGLPVALETKRPPETSRPA